MRAYLAVVLAACLVAIATGASFRPKFDDVEKAFHDFGEHTKEHFKGAVTAGKEFVGDIQKQWQEHQSIKDIPQNVKHSLDMAGDAAKGAFEHVKEHVKQDAQKIGGLFKPKDQPQPAPAPAPAPESEPEPAQ